MIISYTEDNASYFYVDACTFGCPHKLYVHRHTHTHTHSLKAIAVAVKPAIIWIPLLWGCARPLNLHHAVSRNKHIKSESRNKIRPFPSSVFILADALVCSSTRNNKRPIILSTAWWKNTFIGICVNVEKRWEATLGFAAVPQVNIPAAEGSTTAADDRDTFTLTLKSSGCTSDTTLGRTCITGINLGQRWAN